MDNRRPAEAHRPDDDDGRITITRSIPLPWVLSVLAAIAAQATVVYFTQQRQGEILQTVAVEVKQLSSIVNTQASGKIEQDFKIADHERRLTTIERKQ